MGWLICVILPLVNLEEPKTYTIWDDLVATILIVNPEIQITYDYKIAATHIRRRAIELELLDPDISLLRTEDIGFIEFRLGLKEVQETYELLKDAPLDFDRNRFPPYEEVYEKRKFILEVKKVVQERMENDLVNGIHYYKMHEELERLHTIWDWLCDAACSYRITTTRRKGLLKLRTLIGEEAYYRGQMPYIPLEWFKEIN